MHCVQEITLRTVNKLAFAVFYAESGWRDGLRVRTQMMQHARDNNYASGPQMSR